jgi:hypothetical protein
MNHRRAQVLRLALLASLAVAHGSVFAGGALDLPVQDAAGDPIDVGLLILGHSTSAVGDWPAKLANVLNADLADGRNYVVLRAITTGDGGFLWSQLSFAPNDLEYDRVQSSQFPSQWCQDASAVRWSCRRLRLERGLAGTEPAPPECAPPSNTCTAPTLASCVWHEGGQRFQQPNAPFKSCWDHMDIRLALVQDTSNRSWAVDDQNGDGTITPNDWFIAADVNAQSRPCGGTSGVIGPWIDWDCNGLMDARDGSADRYGDWMGRLASDVLDGFGSAGADHVFFSPKPVEMNGCPYYQGQTCTLHGVRTPTPSRPFDHFYFPTVFWEIAGLKSLLARADLDPRIHWAVPLDPERMWTRSAQCYDVGIVSGDWAIPASSGRPASISADDTEDDANPASASAIGCLLSDHVHHNEAGGWMMADVWYAGLRPYLSDTLPLPSEASDPGRPPLRVTARDPVSGLLTVDYAPACGASDHALHAGPLAAISQHTLDRTVCGLGVVGSAVVDVGEGDRYFLIAGRNGYVEGPLGADSMGAPRAGPPAIGPCWLPMRTGGACP